MKSYFEIEGDGGSDIVAQVEAQQASIQGALAGVRHLVAVGSGKGGVGKSTVTAALARSLAGLGKKVAILDADFNGPCQAELAGLGKQPWLPGETGLSLPKSREGIGILSMGSLLEENRPVEFDSFSKGDEFTWRASQEFTLLGQLLAGVEWKEQDFLLIDLPPGTERTQQYAQFFGGQTAFVLVTIPSSLSRSVVSRSVTALQESGARLVGVIENMSGYFCRQCGEVRPLFPSMELPLSLPNLGRIPFDPSFAELGSLDLATSVAPSTVAIKEAANQLIKALEGES